MSNTKSVQLTSSSSQYLSIVNSSLSTGFPGASHTGDITIEAWINLTSVDTGLHAVATKSTAGSNPSESFWFTIWNNKLYFDYEDGSGSVTSANMDYVFSSSDIGEWIHVAVTADVSATTIKFYKDGSLADSTNGTANATEMVNGSAPFFIGAESSSSPYRFFNGKIDEVRVWSDVRTATEISDNYDSEISVSSANLEGYWQMENGSTDSTSNGNDLTNNNSATFSTDVPFSGGTPTTTYNALAMCTF